jgi:hypothetical protein
MQPVPNVRTQVALFLAVDALIVAGCGDAISRLTVYIVAVGVGVWAVCAGSYHARRWAHERSGHEVSRARKRQDRYMAILTLLAFGLPLGFAIAMQSGLRIRALAFSSDASTVAAALLLVAGVSILGASIFDWYVIRPFQCGVLNRPLCSPEEPPDEQTRRAYANWWVANRGTCEMVAYTCGAVVLTIAFAALAESVQTDAVLRVALGSFIGASTAFGLVAYVLERARHAWGFLNVQHAGLGRWARGRNPHGEIIEGFVRDVSVFPGVQVCSAPDEPDFVRLSDAASLQEIKHGGLPLCALGCRRWVERCDRHFLELERAEALLGEFPAHTVAELMERVTGPPTDLPSKLGRWREQERIVEITIAGKPRYPAFQFTDAGVPRPVIASVLAALRRYPHRTELHELLWFLTPHPALDERRPVELLDAEPGLVVAVATDSVMRD